VPENCQWIYVGDSGSDVYTFWQTCEELGYDFVLRVAQDRDVEVPQEEAAERLDEAHLKTLVRSLAAHDAQVVSIPAQRQQPKCEALLQITFQRVPVQPPLNASQLAANGDHGLGGAGLGDKPTGWTRTVGMDFVEHAPDHVRQ
jgi:hypothetical protein